jgi:hypothetical protein
MTTAPGKSASQPTPRDTARQVDRILTKLERRQADQQRGTAIVRALTAVKRKGAP